MSRSGIMGTLSILIIGMLVNVGFFAQPSPTNDGDNIEGRTRSARPIAEWFFDEGIGQEARDNTGNGNHLQLGTGSGVDSADPAWSGGWNGTCLDFDRSDDRLKLSSSNQMDITGEFTIDSWIKTTSTATYQMIADKTSGTYTSMGYSFYLTNGRLRLSIYDGTSSEGGLQSLSTVRDGSWHYVAVTLNNTHGSLYIDGVMDNSRLVAKRPGSSSVLFHIGLRSTGWGGYMPFDGEIDQVSVFDRSLTDDDIWNRYIGFEPKYSYWPMDEGTGQTVQEVISGNDGHCGEDYGSDIKDPSWYFGVNGTGLSFDGSDDVVTIPSPDLGIGDSFTISLWCWTDIVEREQDLITHQRVVNGTKVSDLRLSIKDSKVNFNARWDGITSPAYFPKFSGDPFVSTRTVPRGRWANIVVSSNDEDGKFSIYINGAVSGSVTLSDYPGLNEIPDWYLANGEMGSSPFKGWMDEVRIWNYGLNMSQIQKEFSNITIRERTPSEPLDLSVEPGDSYLILNWSNPRDNGTALITDYRILKGTMPNMLTPFTYVSPKTFTFVDTNVVNGVTYYYSIKAINAIGEGPLSEIAFGTPMGPPTAPRNLELTEGDSFLELRWSPPFTDGGSPITRFSIQRDIGLGFRPLVNISGLQTSYNDTDVENGVDYRYIVKAVNRVGESPFSDPVTGMPRAIPSPPLDLTVASGNRWILLQWAPPEDDGGSTITGFVVYKKMEDEGHFQQIRSLGAVDRSYNDTDVMNGQRYLYYIRAFNQWGGSTPSITVTAVPMTVPDPPRDIGITFGDSYLLIEWAPPNDDGGADVMSYKVYWLNVNGLWELKGEAFGSERSYNDTGLINGRTYDYRVSAVNIAGESILSEPLSEKPRTVPSPPVNLTIDTGDSFNHIRWSMPSDDGGDPVVAVKVNTLTPDGTMKIIADLGPGSTDLNHTELENGRTYIYWVSCRNSVGSSPLSKKIEGRPLAVPEAPEDLITVSGDGYVHLFWKPPLEDGGLPIRGYKVYRSFQGLEPPFLLVDLSSGARDHNDTLVQNGRSYSYFVLAYNDLGESLPSPEANGRPISTDNGKDNSVLLVFIALFLVIMIITGTVLTFVVISRGSQKEKAGDTGATSAVPSPSFPRLPPSTPIGKGAFEQGRVLPPSTSISQREYCALPGAGTPRVLPPVGSTGRYQQQQAAPFGFMAPRPYSDLQSSPSQVFDLKTPGIAPSPPPEGPGSKDPGNEQERYSSDTPPSKGPSGGPDQGMYQETKQVPITGPLQDQSISVQDLGPNPMKDEKRAENDRD